MRKHFPIKTKSLDEFVELAMQQISPHISVEPAVKVKNVFKDSLIGAIGEVEYSILLRSESPYNRPIIFNEVYATEASYLPKTLSDQEYSRLISTTNEQFKKIKEKLPALTIEIKNPFYRSEEKFNTH